MDLLLLLVTGTSAFIVNKLKIKPIIKNIIRVVILIVFFVALIAISKVQVEREIINEGEPVIYTRKSQYLTLYEQNKDFLNDLVKTLKENKVDYIVI